MRGGRGRVYRKCGGSALQQSSVKARINTLNFIDSIVADAEEHEVKLTAKRKKLLQTSLAVRDENAKEVIARSHKPGKVEANPLCGFYEVELAGKKYVVEYEPDTELRDTEQIPLLEEGGIEAFLKREVLPHVPDAWYDPESVRIGYEISFTRYFYKTQPLRSLEEIRADILALKKKLMVCFIYSGVDPKVTPRATVPIYSPERLAYWYFRLNGFLTTENFVVHPEPRRKSTHRR